MKFLENFEFRLSKEEYKQLLGNVQEIEEVHQRLLSSLESAMAQGGGGRIGNLFLTLAAKLKTIHTTYCGNHPRAVCILDRYRYDLMNTLAPTLTYTRDKNSQN